MRLDSLAGFVAHWAIIVVVVWAEALLMPGFVVESLPVMVAGSIVLGLLNAAVRPLLVGLGMPPAPLLLGVAYLILNAFAYGLATRWLLAVSVYGSLSAAIAIIVTSLASLAVARLITRRGR